LQHQAAYLGAVAVDNGQLPLLRQRYNAGRGLFDHGQLVFSGGWLACLLQGVAPQGDDDCVQALILTVFIWRFVLFRDIGQEVAETEALQAGRLHLLAAGLHKTQLQVEGKHALIALCHLQRIKAVALLPQQGP
jgi:hypothetical protein